MRICSPQLPHSSMFEAGGGRAGHVSGRLPDAEWSPVWMETGPSGTAALPGQTPPYSAAPMRRGWGSLILPLHRERGHRGQCVLDIEQAHAVLAHLMDAPARVGLGFHRAEHDEDAILRALCIESPSEITLRGESYLAGAYRGTGANLLLTVDDQAQGFVWPSLLWSVDQEWALLPVRDTPFTMLAAPEDICGRVAADPRTEALPPGGSIG